MKRIIYSLFMILFLFSLKSCKYAESIDNKLFVSGIGIDINEDGDYSLSFSHPDISEFSPESSKIKGSDSISGFGKTFYGAVRDVVSKSNKIVDFEHVKVIVLSSNVSKDSYNLEKLLDYLSHEPSISRRVYLCVGDGDAKDFIGFKVKSGEDSQVFIRELLEHNYEENGIKTITLNDVLDSFSQNKNILIPVLKLNEDKNAISMGGSYVLDKYNFIKEVSMKDSMIINFLRGDNSRITDDISFKNTSIDYEIQNVNRKIYNTNPRNINICFTLKTLIRNCIDNDHDENDDFIKEVKNKLNNDIHVKCTNLVNGFYKEGIDILNFRDYFYKFKTKDFKKYEVPNGSWINTVLINIVIENSITNTGNISF